MKKYSLLSIGLAMFTLLFGPGNIIYPLKLGALTGTSLWYGLCGFIITAVFMPIIGFVATLLCHGKYTEILSYLGRIPGAIITFICMLLIGPFCVIPRCISLAYETLKYPLGGISLPWFSMLAAGIVFLATIRKELIMPLFGKIFGPIKLLLIFGIIAVGAFTQASSSVGLSAWLSFKQGIIEGYSTMDLLGTLFCAGLLATQLLAGQNNVDNRDGRWKIATKALQAASIGGLFLAFVYAGFFYISGIHADVLQGISQADMFSVLAHYLLGPIGGVLASSVIILTCLTTAIALSSIVADYVRMEVFSGYFSYKIMLFATLTIAGLMSNVGFYTIMQLVEPLITVFYPLLVVLALVVIMYKLLWEKTLEIVPAVRGDNAKNSGDSFNDFYNNKNV